jgi:hypothetical protein
MPIDIGSHPQYGAEAARFRAARDAATTSGDEIALAKANEEWANVTARMSAEMYERQDQERGRSAQLARIKAENPAVPDSVYEGISDLDQAERIAKEFQALAAQRPTQGQPMGGTWSPPPGGQPAGEPDDVVDPNEQRDPDTGILPSVQRRMDKLSPTVLQKGAAAREDNAELQRLSLEPLTTRFQTRR